MKLIIYPLLQTRSKRAITRTKKKWGHSYQYRPRIALVKRLMEELSWTREQVLQQIHEERQFMLKNQKYYQ